MEITIDTRGNRHKYGRRIRPEEVKTVVKTHGPTLLAVYVSDIISKVLHLLNLKLIALPPSLPPRHQHYSTRTRHVKGERDNAAEEESPLAYMLIIYLFKLLTQSAPSSIQRIDAPGERRRGRESLLNY